MAEFLSSLTLFQQIVMAIVAPATVILLLQFVLLMLGLGGHDADTDSDADVSDGLIVSSSSGVDVGTDMGGEALSALPAADNDAAQSTAVFGMLGGLKLFTFRGILAFLAIGGWTALLVSLADSVFWAVVAGLLAGAFADIIYGLLIKSMSRLSESGNIDARNALGKTGEVYIPIPPNRLGTGKINIELQGRVCELEAVSDSPEALKTGSKIVVLDIAENSLLVEPLDSTTKQ